MESFPVHRSIGRPDSGRENRGKKKSMRRSGLFCPMQNLYDPSFGFASEATEGFACVWFASLSLSRVCVI